LWDSGCACGDGEEEHGEEGQVLQRYQAEECRRLAQASAESSTLSLRVAIDCLKVNGNRAVLAGLVKESNVGAYIGRRMLLAVEDGGEGHNAAPDRYTWGQYRSTAAT
jgi:hypothetical protein